MSDCRIILFRSARHRPGRAECVLHVAGEEGGIHEGGGLHCLAEGGAELGEAGEVGGEGVGDCCSLVGRDRDQIREVYVVEDA